MFWLVETEFLPSSFHRLAWIIVFTRTVVSRRGLAAVPAEPETRADPRGDRRRSLAARRRWKHPRVPVRDRQVVRARTSAACRPVKALARYFLFPPSRPLPTAGFQPVLRLLPGGPLLGSAVCGTCPTCVLRQKLGCLPPGPKDAVPQSRRGRDRQRHWWDNYLWCRRLCSLVSIGLW